MNVKKLFYIVSALSVLFLVSSCNNDIILNPSNLGKMRITLTQDGVNARALIPNITMVIHSYDVSATGPGGAVIPLENISAVSPSWEKTGIIPGAWTVTVAARNDSSVIIGTGSAAFTVAPGENTNATVTVIPLILPGTLSLSVSWPPAMVPSPIISGTLTPLVGSAQTIPLTVNSAAGSAAYSSNALNPGYYILNLLLRNGATNIWGRTETVRIVTGGTTTGTFTLATGDITGGGLDITITGTLNNPPILAISGSQTTLTSGENMNLSASLTPALSGAVWAWYVDGVLVTGATANTLTIGAALPIGMHWIDCMAIGSGVAASDGFKVDVQ